MAQRDGQARRRVHRSPAAVRRGAQAAGISMTSWSSGRPHVAASARWCVSWRRTGRPIPEFLLHIEGEDAWWRSSDETLPRGATQVLTISPASAAVSAGVRSTSSLRYGRFVAWGTGGLLFHVARSRQRPPRHASGSRRKAGGHAQSSQKGESGVAPLSTTLCIPCSARRQQAIRSGGKRKASVSGMEIVQCAIGAPKLRPGAGILSRGASRPSCRVRT